jgi:peptidoglycan L-alanyl-D-glutamate endopeptidase CwlK
MSQRKIKISLLHQRLANAAECILAETIEAGWDFQIFETWRTPARQQRLFEEGRTKARAWRSWHQYGLAVDIVAMTPGGDWSWDKKHDWRGLGNIGKAYGLTWGGDFKRIKDMVHFQLPVEFDIAEAEKIVRAEGILGLWDRI